jgi:hypothetical protein
MQQQIFDLGDGFLRGLRSGDLGRRNFSDRRHGRMRVIGARIDSLPMLLVSHPQIDWQQLHHTTPLYAMFAGPVPLTLVSRVVPASRSRTYRRAFADTDLGRLVTA